MLDVTRRRDQAVNAVGGAFLNMLDGQDHRVPGDCYQAVELALQARYGSTRGKAVPTLTLHHLAQRTCRLGEHEMHLVERLQEFSQWDHSDGALLHRHQLGLNSDDVHELFFETRELVTRLIRPATTHKKPHLDDP